MDKSKTIKAILSALEHESRIKLHTHPVKVDLEPDGTAVLEGELPSIAAKKLALRHAAAVPGVDGIVDRLRVKPSKRMGDGEIRNHVRDALMEEPAFDSCAIRIQHGGQWQTFREATTTPPYSIDVVVDDGVVTLDGQVNSLSQKRLAGALAWWVPGSRDVIDGIEVTPPEEDNDAEITEAVKLVLEKDPLINGDRVRVHTRDAVVTLEGIVTNDAEREMAEMDAWCITGVEEVDSRLGCTS